MKLLVEDRGIFQKQLGYLGRFQKQLGRYNF